MKIVFCASEAVPYIKTGGLADICGTLPGILAKKGIDIALFLPKYSCIDEKKFKLEEINSVLWHTKVSKNLNVYFIANDAFFVRDGIYGDKHGDYADNLERFAYFNQEVLKQVENIDFKPDVIHCHDWQAALIPVYLEVMASNSTFFQETKTLLTIHNMAFQGVFSESQFDLLGLPGSLIDSFLLYEKINFLKAGMINANSISTVSLQYSKEIQTREFGCGLDEVVLALKGKITGIVNGLNVDYWNPATDDFLVKKYSLKSVVEGKNANKKALCHALGFKDETKPVFGMVTRLTHQKGIDLLIESLEDIVRLGVRVSIIGLGDHGYEEQLKAVADTHQDEIAVSIGFDEELAHLLYAGSDFLLMPSRFEPCGLAQMIAMRYGTIPIAHQTGGLVDTIIDINKDADKATGILFPAITKDAFLTAIRQATQVYQDKSELNKVIKNAMQADFSWEQSASAYSEIYSCL